jgi:aldose 1-epimerase
MPSTITELPPVSISSDSTVRIFQLDLNNVTVELSSLGASITKVLLPNYSSDDPNDRDDVVLSYASPKEQYEDKNSVYFGAIVGRVANRIKNGKFELNQLEYTADGPVERLVTYQLDTNNGPNHLHGGFDGFSNRNWSAAVVEDGKVQFTLISPDGDQGYPGGVEVKATYSLGTNKDCTLGAQLHLSMQAKLLPGETKATPISLSQHCYFNLASHSSKERILKHILEMPSHKYTPVDQTSIPTREVASVENSAMDFRKGEILSEAMVRYGKENGLDPSTAKCNVHQILDSCEVSGIGKEERAIIYGFDHNYVIDTHQPPSEYGLHVAGILQHPRKCRSLQVSTNAPGVQLYSSNYLNGMDPKLCKDNCSYNRWQGICLETQAYPDSIYPQPRSEGDGEFANEKCFILRPGESTYLHDVVFQFSPIVNNHTDQ